MSTPEQREELIHKTAALVQRDFGGDYDKAFKHYGDADGKVNHTELIELLKDAGVGNPFTRGMWADGIMEEVDTDKDGMISREEFNKVIGR